MNQLPVETRSKLRSTQIITSLPSLISELFQNSLDASASSVELGVDCEAWSCWVKDDGLGIHKEDLAVLAQGVEQARYGTSKAYDSVSLGVVTTLGFRGEALASIADVSCLEISTRTANSRESWSIILKKGQCLYNGPSLRWRRETPGTVVYIRDAFFNLPIRRRAHPNHSKTFEMIRQEVETYALAFPSVAFALQMENDDPSSSSKKKSFRVPGTDSRLATFRRLFGRSLAEHVEEIHEEENQVTIDGFISLNGAHSQAYQYLFLNRHPLSPCDLHRVIENRFATSTFSKHALDEAGELEQPYAETRRSPRKAMRRQVYALNITIPSSDVDNCLDPGKAVVHLQNRGALGTFLSSIIERFLVKHGFLQARRPMKRSESSDSFHASPSKRRKVDTGVVARAASLQPSAAVRISLDDGENSAEPLLWTDPRTGERFQIDQRTGNSFLVGNTGSTENNGPVLRRRRTLAPQLKETSVGDGTAPSWIQSALKSNDVYTLTQKKVPALHLASAFTSQLQLQGNHTSHACQRSAILHQQGETSSLRFTVEDLRNAEVIQQVDCKFIACLMGSSGAQPGADENNSDRTLVLIDQHAADERVRVERFMEELCSGFLRQAQGVGEGVKVKILDPPIPVLLTRHEAEQLSAFADIQRAFSMWGIEFTAMPTRTNHSVDEEADRGYCQAYVKNIPEVVSRKLLMDDELRELVKGYLGHLETTGIFPPAKIPIDPAAADSAVAWMKALRWCPRELLDLLNSKACRGAIMFNDVLSTQQCKELVERLSRTALPFQCAHGRPSLVPLAKFDSASRGPVEGERGVNWKNLDVER